ncbi:TonB-dependent receptor [candidate division KSB1 bacterium]|nr:TonB-dependent receptor [candidate division KSB1 bacterium]
MKRVFFILILLFSAAVSLSAPATSAAPRGTVLFGTVRDSLLERPVEYANVVLFQQNTRKQVTGTVSDKSGRFELPRVQPGTYILTVKFIGYERSVLRGIEVQPGMPRLDVGEIVLQQAVIMLDGVQTTAERAAIEYQIDRKVVNVSKQYTAASGSAVDVLENVPAVTVDIEGNVSLRGSSSFTVLIDGRPSILDANDALRQIPASSIENIEIITNPSAKYDPEGTAGIINIISKKNSLNGVNGLISINAGDRNRYGADVLLNYRTSRFNVYGGADFNKHGHPGSSRQENRTFRRDTTSYILSEGERERSFTGWSIRTGADWNISDSDLLSLGLRYGERDGGGDSRLDYQEWVVPGDPERRHFVSLNSSERGGPFASVNLNYKHDFAGKGHQLLAEVHYRNRGGKETNTDELLDGQGVLQSGRRTTEQGPGNHVRLKLDYTRPFSEESKFEAGYQSELGRSSDETEMEEYDPATGFYFEQPRFSHEIDYQRNIHALYATYAGKVGALGFQGGLRNEYTYRTVELSQERGKYTIDRWDLFPTAHFSYHFNREEQAMASYTRRIVRPRGWNLEPFITWVDAYNVRRGNPDLKPEYIDSYETGYQKNFGRNLFSVEGYYRVTHNKVERIQEVYQDNVMLGSVANVGRDYTFGTEVMLNLDLFRWWNINWMGNLYDYRIEGALSGEDFSRKSTNWSIRFNHSFRLIAGSRLQVNFMYNSPSESAQGRREDFTVTNLALKKSFLDDHLELIAQVRDVFSTGKFEFTAEGRDFYRYSYFTREAPIYSLTVNYLINNYKQKRQRENGDNGMEMEFEEM